MNLNHSRRDDKQPVGPLQRGSVLLEAVAALVLLAITGLALLKGSLNTLAPRQWALVQNISDAHLTYEQSYAERIPFGEFSAAGSPWPVYPSKDTSTVVLGTLPGGGTLSGTLIRTRVPDPINLPAFGGSGTLATNPAEMQVWQLRSILLFEIGGRPYTKGRVVVRSK